MRDDNLLITLPRDMMRTDTPQRAPIRAHTPVEPSSQNLTTKQAAHYLQVSVKWLELRRKKGGGPKYHRLGAKLIVYMKSNLDAWLNSRECA